MTQYIVRRLLLLIPTIFLVTLTLFVLIRVTPGDPVRNEFGLDITPQLLQARRHQLGLDRPIAIQYVDWLGRLARLDFGRSLRTPQPVRTLLFDRFPATLELAIVSFVVSLVASVALGTLSAVYNRSWFGPTTTALTLVSISLPGFFLATLLVYFVTFRWRLLPSPRYVPLNKDPLQSLKFIILPVLALSVGSVARQTRIIRSNVLEALYQDYMRTARAKGLSETAIVLRHGLRNAMLPSVTLIGLGIATLWEGSFIIEVIFNWPGVGRFAVTSLMGKDYPVVQATVLLAAISISFSNLVVDVLYAKESFRNNFPNCGRVGGEAARDGVGSAGNPDGGWTSP